MAKSVMEQTGHDVRTSMTIQNNVMMNTSVMELGGHDVKKRMSQNISKRRHEGHIGDYLSGYDIKTRISTKEQVNMTSRRLYLSCNTPCMTSRQECM